jgi:hypothetical protein
MSKKLVEARLAFRKWIKSLKKRVICFYPREDRGSAVIFDVGSRRELNEILRDWRTFINTRLDVYPLQDPVLSEKMLEKQLHRLKIKEERLIWTSDNIKRF